MGEPFNSHSSYSTPLFITFFSSPTIFVRRRGRSGFCASVNRSVNGLSHGCVTYGHGRLIHVFDGYEVSLMSAAASSGGTADAYGSAQHGRVNSGFCLLLQWSSWFDLIVGWRAVMVGSILGILGGDKDVEGIIGNLNY